MDKTKEIIYQKSDFTNKDSLLTVKGHNFS